METKYHSKHLKYNALFVPGFPGAYKERELTRNLRKLGFNIHTVQYPGINSDGQFAPLSVLGVIKDAIDHLESSGKPLLVISYSFSSLFVNQALKGCSSVMGVIHFSPIFDLKDSIRDDFIQDLKTLSDPDWNIDIKAFESYVNKTRLKKNPSYEGFASTYPQIFCYGQEDKVVKINCIEKGIADLRKGGTPALGYSVKAAGHKLDDIYTKHIYKYIVSLVFSAEVKQVFHDVSLYLWGAQLNYRYAGPDSDIDIIILGNNFSLEDKVLINKLVNTLGKQFGVTIDVITNTYAELASDARIRSNRGPSFIHELMYYYLPLIVDEQMPSRSVSKSDVITDAAYAISLNHYRSHKAILNYVPGTTASNWILKLFIISCYYEQYSKGHLRVNQNNIDSCYRVGSKTRALLDMIRNYKLNEKTPSYNDLIDIVKEQERIVNIFNHE